MKAIQIFSVVLISIVYSCGGSSSISEDYCNCYQLDSTEVENCKEEYFKKIELMRIEEPIEYEAAKEAIRDCEISNSKEG
jgi:hypothetical protein